MSFRKIKPLYLFIFSCFLYLFYYLSAFFTHTLDPFFVWAGTGGMDFFQIPNGAYAFLHGGSLNGALPSGIQPYAMGGCCGVNANVYHPLFTLLVGVPLQLLSPQTAMAVWAFVHLFTMGGLVAYLWSKFATHKYKYLALSVLLVFSYNYYEIWLNQYHFLFTLFTVLFVYESMRQGDTKKAGLWLFLSLLVKPVGLLWILPLLLYKRFTTVGLGFGLFFVATFLFVVFPFQFGEYYVKNFFSVASDLRPSANLYALSWLLPGFDLHWIRLLSVLSILGLIWLQLVKRPSIFILITLWTGFQLLFYGLVFHYHYSVLSGLIALGILLNELKSEKRIVIPVLFLTLPALPVFLFDLSVRGLSRGTLAYVWLYSAFWLLMLLIGISREERKNPPEQA